MEITKVAYSSDVETAAAREQERSPMRTVPEVEALLAGISDEWWTDDPAPTWAVLDRLEAELVAGPEQFASAWGRGVMRGYSLGRIDNPLPPALRYRLGDVAGRMAPVIDALPTEDQGDVAYLRARFHEAAGQTAKALAAGEDALRRCADPEGVTALRARSLLSDLRWREGGRQGEPPLEEYLEAERVRSHAPSIALGIIRGGHVLLTAGCGAADVEASFPATSDTVYQICSIAKTFTATGLMLLAQEGRLTLEDSITRWLPQLPPTLADVTLRHMLSHTSGIRNIWERIVAEVRAPEDLARIRSELTRESAPGERYDYNNTAFHLLGLVFPAVTGKTHAEFIEERIMRPLGMQITPSREPAIPADRRARGYTWDSGALQAVSEGKGFWTSGAGGFASTVSDLIRWDAALETETLLPRWTWEQIWTPSTLNDGTPIGTGLGWGTGTLLGRRKIGHLGGDRGFRSSFNRYLEDRLTIILLANSDRLDQSYVEEGIAKYFLRPLTIPGDPDPETTARLKQVLLGLAAGRADPDAFAPETQPRLAAELLETAAFYHALGPLGAFDFLERQSCGSSTAFRCRALFGKTPWIQSFMLNEAGQVVAFPLERRRAL